MPYIVSFFASIISFEKMKTLFKGNLYYFGYFLLAGHFIMGLYAVGFNSHAFRKLFLVRLSMEII